MPWILFLEPFTECAHSVKIRTDTTLDQDCVLKATVQVCTVCMVVSLLTTCMNFNTPPLAQIAPFDARFARQTRKKARLPTQSVQASECRSDHHGSCTITAWLKKKKKRLLSLSSTRVIGLRLGSKSCSPSRQTSQYSRNFVLLVALALLLALALLIAVMIRSSWEVPQTCPPFLVSISLSIRLINTDKCLFLFLLRVCLGSPCTYRGCSLPPDPS